MEKDRISMLLVREAEVLFRDIIASEITKNIGFTVAPNSNEIIKCIYIHDPDFIVFNISNLNEDNYQALYKLKHESENKRYQLLFIHNAEEAGNVVAALAGGISAYHLKLLEIVEKNAQILNFLELRQNREEMQLAYIELKKAMVEMNKKNNLLQAAIRDIEKLTVTDYLTGLYNRRYILDRIRQEVVRYNRNGRVFSFVLCDIDNFKKVNDTYGHDFGDQMLVETANYLKESCREMDILSRWGGDEFLFLLPETDVAGAVTFCERVQQRFEDKTFVCDRVEIKTSLTFGVAEYDEKLGASESIKNADRALLAGKGERQKQSDGQQALIAQYDILEIIVRTLQKKTKSIHNVVLRGFFQRGAQEKSLY